MRTLGDWTNDALLAIPIEERYAKLTPLVYSVARKMQPRLGIWWNDADDFYQEGRMALWEALVKFDPDHPQKMKIIVWCYSRIRQRLTDWIRGATQRFGRGRGLDADTCMEIDGEFEMHMLTFQQLCDGDIGRCEFLMALQKSLQVLKVSPKVKRILWRCFSTDYTYREISRSIGATPPYVSQLVDLHADRIFQIMYRHD